MSWKFWKRDEEPEFTVETLNIPMTTIARWYLYDMQATDPERYAAALGLNAISEEGSEKEEQDSVERMTKVIPYEEYAGIIADINAQVLLLIRNKDIRQLVVDEDLEDEAAALLDELDDATYELFTRVSYTAILSALSIGFNTGLFSPGSSYAHEVSTD